MATVNSKSINRFSSFFHSKNNQRIKRVRKKATLTEDETTPASTTVIKGESTATGTDFSSKKEESNNSSKDFTSSILIGDLAADTVRRTQTLDETSTSACKTLFDEVEQIINSAAGKQTIPPDNTTTFSAVSMTTANYDSNDPMAAMSGADMSNQSDMINAMNNSYLSQPFKSLALSVEPKHLLALVHERLECFKKVDINASTSKTAATTATPITTTAAPSSFSAVPGCGSDSTGSSANLNSKVKCVPSARTINCTHHCVAILATRLFALLCNETVFQQRLMGENQEQCFNYIVDILYPNNDPVSLMPFMSNFIE